MTDDDLKAIEELADYIGEQYAGRGPANLAKAAPRLVAEVRRLRAAIERHRDTFSGESDVIERNDELYASLEGASQ